MMGGEAIAEALVLNVWGSLDPQNSASWETRLNPVNLEDLMKMRLPRHGMLSVCS